MSKRRSLLACLGLYALALAVAALVVWWTPTWPAWARLGAADLAATIVVFRGSVTFNNSSFYDPYWSVAPVVMAAYLFLVPANADAMRALVVLVVLVAWGARLTFNWVRRWHGTADEDWRYADLRARTGAWYWLVSWVGLHLLPTAVVFIGCAGAYAALHAGTLPWGWLDTLAALFAVVAIAIETVADQQLRRFLDAPRADGAILATGLWSWSRHPNYFGELLFWWAIALFGAAAAPNAWWVWLGPVTMTALFAFVSLPLIERRSRNKPGWSDYARRTSVFVPWPPAS